MQNQYNNTDKKRLPGSGQPLYYINNYKDMITEF